LILPNLTFEKDIKIILKNSYPTIKVDIITMDMAMIAKIKYNFAFVFLEKVDSLKKLDLVDIDHQFIFASDEILSKMTVFDF